MTDDEHKKIRVATLNTLNNPKLLSERGSLIIDELLEIQPDIICLQEVMKETPFNLPHCIQRDLKLAGYVFGDRVPTKYEGITSGNVILSKTEIASSRVIGPVSTSKEITSIAITTEVHGNRVDVISSHFAWGGDNEILRQQQAASIDKYARRIKDSHSDALVIVGGDFNTTPDSDMNRYLDGKTALGVSSTLWVDAYDTVGLPEEEMTSRVDNEFARSTARSVGIRYPELVPPRRIDYIKAFGYTYGKTGSPLLCRRWADSTDHDGLTISDHYGLYADFLIE